MRATSGEALFEMQLLFLLLFVLISFLANEYNGIKVLNEKRIVPAYIRNPMKCNWIYVLFGFVWSGSRYLIGFIPITLRVD